MSLYYQDTLTEEERWQEAEDERLEYEGYCNKIRKGLEDLDEKSGVRAIWELVQNARDQKRDDKVGVSIKIELTPSALIFSHHGKPFDYTSFRALVKQDSSKDKTDAKQVGQYGTGFMTTHQFNRLVYVSAPYIVKKGKDIISGFYQIKDFELDRTKVDKKEGPAMMKEQLIKVKEFCKQPLSDVIEDDITSFRYDLSTAQVAEVSAQLTSAMRLLPFVMVINRSITNIEVIDHNCNKHNTYTKRLDQEPKDIEVKGWKEHSDIVVMNEGTPSSETFTCKSLRSEKGDVIIIPPYPPACGNVNEIPSLFLWFPLLGTESFGVNFIFHSERFHPVEKRNNIMLPGKTAVRQEKGGYNSVVLNEMMDVLFAYYSKAEHAKSLKREMCEVAFPEICDDEETLKFYKELQSKWKSKVVDWKSIPVNEEYVSISDSRVKLLHPDFYKELNEEQRATYEPTLASYAKLPKRADGVPYLMPDKDLIRWSDTVNRWGCQRDGEFFITVKDVCETIKEKSADLHSFLMLMKDGKNEKVMESYALLPNRMGELRTKGTLYDGKFMTDDVYRLVSGVMGDEAKKIYDKTFLDVTEVNPYTEAELQKDITANINKLRSASLSIAEKKALSTEELSSLVKFCSASHLTDFNNQRGRMMPILCEFYNQPFAKISICKFRNDDEEEFYKSAFNFLLDYTLYQVSLKPAIWVDENKDWLKRFLTEYAPGANEDRKKKLDDYGVLPNQNNVLCKLKDLKRNAGCEDLVSIYKTVFDKDLKDDWIDSVFESVVALSDDKPEEIANKIETILVADMKQENIEDRKFQKTVRAIILKIAKDKRWESWFGQINDKKATYTFGMKSGNAQESLFSLMDLKDDDLGRLAKLNENGQLPDLIYQMERMKELEDEKTSHFNFCLRIGKSIENEIRKALDAGLFEVVTRKEINENLTVKDIQNGQDIIIKNAAGDPVYFIEVKAKWNFDIDTYAHMSLNQLRMAARNPECYSLCCVDLTDKSKIDIPANSSSEFVEQHVDEIIANTRVHLEIGKEIHDIMQPILDADADITETKMRIGDYRGNMTKTAFQQGETFKALVEKIISKLESQ